MSTNVRGRPVAMDTIQRSLAMAMQELSQGNLEDIIPLASAICNCPIWPSTAADFFESHPEDYEVTQEGNNFLVKLRTWGR